MLPKIHRLTKKKDFALVFSKGESAKGGFFIVKVLKNQLPESRFGFVVSKKVSNKATVRNKVKRRLRKAVLDKITEVKKSMDVVIVSLPGIEKKEFLEINEAVTKSFKKIGIL